MISLQNRLSFVSGENEMRNILVYGDSNTWGLHPSKEDRCPDRYPRDVRWPGRLAKMLGDDYYIIESSISGRTTVFDDPMFRNMNGMSLLEGVLASSKPIDMIIISLGANDLKFTDVEGSAKGIGTIIRALKRGDTHFVSPGSQNYMNGKLEIVIVSPVPMVTENMDPASRLYGFAECIPLFSKAYKSVTDILGCHFVDGGLVTKDGISEADGLHMSHEGHRQLADLVYSEIKKVYCL